MKYQSFVGKMEICGQNLRIVEMAKFNIWRVRDIWELNRRNDVRVEKESGFIDDEATCF